MVDIEFNTGLVNPKRLLREFITGFDLLDENSDAFSDSDTDPRIKLSLARTHARAPAVCEAAVRSEYGIPVASLYAVEKTADFRAADLVCSETGLGKGHPTGGSAEIPDQRWNADGHLFLVDVEGSQADVSHNIEVEQSLLYHYIDRRLTTSGVSADEESLLGRRLLALRDEICQVVRDGVGNSRRGAGFRGFRSVCAFEPSAWSARSALTKDSDVSACPRRSG